MHIDQFQKFENTLQKVFLIDDLSPVTCWTHQETVEVCHCFWTKDALTPNLFIVIRFLNGNGTYPQPKLWTQSNIQQQQTIVFD